MTDHTAPQNYLEIGDLGRTPLTPEERDRRTRFALLWQPLIAELKRKGWTEFHPGSVVELYVSEGRSKVLERIWVSPTRGELRVRLDFVDHVTLRNVLANKDSLRSGIVGRERVAIEQLKRTGGTVHVLEVRCALRDLLESAESENDMADRLKEFSLAAIDGAERSATLNQSDADKP